MLTLHGELRNVFTTPGGVDKTTGAAYGGQSKVQILAENYLKNGEMRMDIINLTVENPEDYKPLVGKPVDVPVSCFVMNNSLLFQVLPGAKPSASKPHKVSA